MKISLFLRSESEGIMFGSQKVLENITSENIEFTTTGTYYYKQHQDYFHTAEGVGQEL